MKKFVFILFSLALVLFFTGCGSSDTTSDTKNEETRKETVSNKGNNQKDVNHDEQDHKYTPQEPTSETVCDSCNMQVYVKDHELGVFTAQGVTLDGENVFFDDIGCLLNYERKNGEVLAAEWVRDYLSLEWTELEQATPVKTNIQSPMKYGYISLDSKEKAEEFINDPAKSSLTPILAEWAEVDNMANERFQQKMKMQKQQHQHGQSSSQ